MEPTSLSHDSIFREVFSHVDKASAIIQAALPENISKTLNLDTLTLSGDSYIDANLNEHFADLVYTCQTISQKALTIVLLFEHKSYVEKHLHLQLLRYMTSGWEYQLKQKQRLSPILPIVFYHGSSRWKYTSFVELPGLDDTAAADFAVYIPDFQYAKIDLQQTADDEIKTVLFNDAILRLLALLFKHYHEKAYVMAHLSGWLALVGDVNENEKYYVRLCFRYLLEKVKLNASELMEAIKSQTVLKTEWEKLLEEYIAIGKEQGRSEGILEGKLETARQLKEMGIEWSIITAATGLSEEIIAKL